MHVVLRRGSSLNLRACYDPSGSLRWRDDSQGARHHLTNAALRHRSSREPPGQGVRQDRAKSGSRPSPPGTLDPQQPSTSTTFALAVLLPPPLPLYPLPPGHQLYPVPSYTSTRQENKHSTGNARLLTSRQALELDLAPALQGLSRACLAGEQPQPELQSQRPGSTRAANGSGPRVCHGDL